VIRSAQKTDDGDIDECPFFKIECAASHVFVDPCFQLLQMRRPHSLVDIASEPSG
jgi:hypothetical protein